ncbi:hypothetical protein GCM10029978_083350 [Actinoallomurus acanthiterrae]
MTGPRVPIYGNPQPPGRFEELVTEPSEQERARSEMALSTAIATDPRNAAPLGPTLRPIPSFPDPPPLAEHGPARIVSVCNQKGGVGKTTTTINLGASLAEQGRRVLLVDFDPQGALSVGLGKGDPRQLDLTIYNLLMERGVETEEVILPTSVEGMDLLPSNIDLSGAEVQLVHEVGREYILGGLLKPVVSDYDYIMIDCQPSLGLLTVNALAASQGVLVPLECEYFAMRGVALLMETIEKVTGGSTPSWPSTASWPPCTTRVPSTPARCSAGSWRRSAIRSSTRSSTARSAFRTRRSSVSPSPGSTRRPWARTPTGSWPRRCCRGGSSPGDPPVDGRPPP